MIASLIPASQEIYRRIVLEIADGIIGIDDRGIIRLCNPAAEEIFGWGSGQLVGKPLDILLPQRVRASHAALVHNFNTGNTDARHMGQRSATIVGCRSDGSEINLGITILRTSSAGEAMMVAVIRDISDHIRYQNDLKRLAETDSLSGLLNRRAFRANSLQSLARDPGGTASLALFDLDNFKGINDRFGHDAGDEVITKFSEILRSVCRSSDISGRWGGEEFILFLPGAKADAAAAVVERIRETFSLFEFDWEGPRITLSVSAGLVTAPSAAGDLDEMISQADRALYDAKRGGRNRVVAANMLQGELAG